MISRVVALKNFSANEGDCRCGCGMKVADGILIRMQSFIFMLSRIYRKPVRVMISSGARCWKRNEATPGSAKYSLHLEGRAVDCIFQIQKNGEWEQIPNEDVAALARRSGLFGGVGYIKYASQGQNLIHLDDRETEDGTVVYW